MEKPSYDTYDPAAVTSKNEKKLGIKVARTLNDMMQVMAIRAAVFISEQECPYDEEFDGNDFCATHLIAYIGDEPVACIRMRFFAKFAKLERLAVRREYRNKPVTFKIVRAGIDLIRKKGYSVIYGHSQARLVNFWSRFGFEVIESKPEFKFSDFAYIEIVNHIEPDPDPVSIDRDPYVVIRPEGAWHVPGVLEDSASRPVTSPLIQINR